MALVKPGQGITDIRGGFGGVYFTRDKSGLHCTAKPRRVYQKTAGQKVQRDAFSAARALSKDPRVVSYLMYRYMNGLPLTYDAVVTRTVTPDCTGNYQIKGQYESKDYYRRTDGAWFIWYENFTWYITAELGIFAGPCWYKPVLVDPVGYYTPVLGATGSPYVSTTPPLVPPDYQIPKL